MPFTYKLSYSSRSQYITPKSIGKIVVSRESEEMFFREKMSGAMELAGDDYIFLNDAEKYSVSCCQEILLSVYRRCLTGPETLFWEGTFSLFDISWDFDNQIATVQKISVKDAYTEIFANWQKEFNLLDFTERVSVRLVAGALSNDPEFNPTGTDIYNRGFDFIDGLRFLIRQTLQIAEGGPQASRQQTSSFFTDATNPVTGKANFLNDLVMMHLSDAKRPGATNPAVTSKISLKAFLTAVKQLFNAFWFVDSETGFIRIEHITYFPHYSYSAPPVTLDLTQAQFKDAMSGKNGYSHDTSEIFATEGLEIAINNAVREGASQYPIRTYDPPQEFSSTYFLYANECIPRDQKGERTEQIKTVSGFATDVLSCRINPREITDEGWLLTDAGVVGSERQFRSATLPLSATTFQNGNLSAGRLFKDFHRYYASFNYGSLSAGKDDKGKPMRAKSVKYTKSFPVIQLSNCCGDSYDFSGYIKHPYADKAAVNQLEFDLETEVIDVSLVAIRACDNIPIPDVDDEQDPTEGCPGYGTLLRLEEEEVYCSDGLTTAYFNIFEVYADGLCGEFRVGGIVRYVSDCTNLTP